MQRASDYSSVFSMRTFAAGYAIRNSPFEPFCIGLFVNRSETARTLGRSGSKHDSCFKSF